MQCDSDGCEVVCSVRSDGCEVVCSVIVMVVRWCAV